MRATRNRHDCANDGTCGQSIRSCEIGSTDISFFSNNRDLIVKIPKLPKYSGDKYRNNLYKEAESKQFNQSPKIDDVLSNSFIIKYRYINCTIKYDNLSKQEQNQIETDVKTAYEAFKEKFCLESNNANYDITAYIFNNRSDYAKYNDLLDINADGGPGYTIRGVTDYRNILTYKQVSMDFVLGHELGHIFQMRFSPANKVRDLHEDTEFIANIVGREVEEKNYIAICKPGEDEDKAGRTNPEPGEEPEPGKESEEDTQQPSNSLFNVIYSAVEYIVGSISSFFSWLFEPKEEEQPGQQSDDNHSLFKFDANELGHDVGSNNHLSDNYHPPDELI